MQDIALDVFNVVRRPELIIGITAAVGTPLDFVVSAIREILQQRSYTVETLWLSKFLESLTLASPDPPPDADEFTRISRLMDRGNELRSLVGGGHALALLAVARVYEIRSERVGKNARKYLDGHAFVIRQLKHPDEVGWLRRICGDAFHLIGVYCPESVRKQHLVFHGAMSHDQAKALVERDKGEEHSYGQQLRDTFHRADVFVELPGLDQEAMERVRSQLERYFRLVFGELDRGIITPTFDEYGMHLAYTAALRSADLSRQVGAAVFSRERELLALGANEVPKAGGGQYWEDDNPRKRDGDLGYDANARMKDEILDEIANGLLPQYPLLGEEEKRTQLEELKNRLRSARIMNLIEFGRPVHAEMEAILAAGRASKSVRGGTLYTTTFPCHNCAKHIVGAGITEVIYIEPYPKSLAHPLHEDSISLVETDSDHRVRFRPFVGVAPRRYEALFSVVTADGRQLRRKNSDGTVRRDSLGIRVQAEALTYIDREELAALMIQEFGSTKLKGDDGGGHGENAS